MSLRGLRERHIDRLLAEELSASLEFSGWLARRVLADRVPAADPQLCAAEISHHRANGETDIRLCYDWGSGESAVIHIEDKIDAQPQPRQGARYLDAVAAEDCPAASVLVAPSAWIRRHPNEAAFYDLAVPFEEIAHELGERASELEKTDDVHVNELARRLRWRQGLFDGSATRKVVYAAIQASDLDDWNAAAAEVIDANDGPVLEVAPRQRSEGSNKASRFIRFLEDLPAHRSGRKPQLQLKTAEKKRPGRVSLEVRGGANDGELLEAAQSAGFDLNATKAGTLVISGTTDRLKGLTISESVAHQVERLEDAARVSQELCEWWQAMAHFHAVLTTSPVEA